jgi:methanogen homoaconitase small subunit
MHGQGHAICIGADIDTDLVIAGRYLRTKDRSVWAAHVFEDLNPGLAPRLRGAVLIAGRKGDETDIPVPPPGVPVG